MRVKVSEATPRQLDWMVATAMGRGPQLDMHAFGGTWRGWWLSLGGEYERMPDYSTDWAHGGPIIYRERISIRQWTNVPVVHAYMPVDGAEWACDETSPLIAAMRCYVASKLGDEVDVPEELV